MAAWTEQQGQDTRRVSRMMENMLVEERTRDEALGLDDCNLSRLDASAHSKELVRQTI